MENLWAPWRMSYILEEDKPEGCIFCLATDGQGADGLVLGVGRLSLVMMNKYPYNNGHLLVAPKRHLPNMDDLSAEEMADLLTTVRRATHALKKVMNPEGFNVGLNLGRVAGAGIEEHMHFHVVPRWGGDTNFMTLFGEIRVIPEHIQATYEKLKPFFADMQ
ncbi:MAG: HIT domain-containing protein [Desulfarculus sp.]|nr:HIT domain-containing protein [Pseudomonadota bacterium]MBV1714514.1 HIT domain-containing protein [Desulfarculus sp.]MBU4575482.1 HIT domain-containing protein [Pseudomonadota bacterium]MBU4599850.1 HIT domain-containing protein [Pseudomonadota bacterium]MBV1737135.1 HIT domain-containing protein [Desulfarculus sp.]